MLDVVLWHLWEGVQLLHHLLDPLRLLPLSQHHLHVRRGVVASEEEDVLAGPPVGGPVLLPELAGDLGQGPLVLGDELGVAGVGLNAPPVCASRL